MKQTYKISTLALSAAVAAALALGGCGKKEAGEAPKQALTAMSLNESGSGIISWGDKKGSAGTYTFTDVSVKSNEQGDITFGKLKLVGVHMEGDQANFDKITFIDMHAKSVENGSNSDVTIKNISLIKPSPALANAIAASFGGDKDAFDNISGDIKFGGFSLAGMKVTDDNAEMKLDALNFGRESDKTGVISLSNFNMHVTDKENVTFHLGSMNATGINLEKYDGLISAAIANGSIGDKVNKEGVNKKVLKAITSSLNPYSPDFKKISLKDFSFDVDGIVGNLQSMTSKSVKKGDTIILTSKMSPLTIRAPKEATEKTKEFTDALTTLGYEELSFSMATTSELNETNDSMKVYDSYIELKDGFRLSYDLDMTNYRDYMQKVNSAQFGGNKDDFMKALSIVKLNKFKIAFRDDSILDRSFKLAAMKQGTSVKDLRQKATMGLAFLPMMAQDEGQQKIAGQLSKALGSLLSDGGTVTVNMNPNGVVDMSEVIGAMSGEFDISKLSLEILHHK
ncbi:MAG: hypothetical protein V3U57_06445 [Robiginitomaculum sp.]